MSQQIAVTQQLYYTNRQRWIYEQVTEMSRTLGIPTPTVLIAGVDGTPKELLHSRDVLHYRRPLGMAFPKTHELYVNPTAVKQYQKTIKLQPKYYNYRHNGYYKIDKDKYSLRHTLAHELIHLTFPNLEHGDRFEDYYVDSLLQGHMVFYKHKQIEMIITKVTEPPKDKNLLINSEIEELQERIKRWDTKRKRAEIAIKKLRRKLTRLERKQEK